MNINIFRNEFYNVMSREFLHLPKRWDGKDFGDTLEKLFDKYIESVKCILDKEKISDIEGICDNIIRCINHYGSGANKFRTTI